MVKPSEKRLAHFRDLVAFDRALPGFGTSLAGMDEAGRGPLVGNVVAACVILPAQPLYEWIDDSKRLSPKRREEMYERIMETALFVEVGEASPEEIDRLNILNATRLAMRRAAERAPATLCVVDAVTGLDLPFPVRSVIRGDASSYHVAAASIVAKVTRDRQMRDYALRYPEYGFEHNMGYGTAEHIAALRTHGPTPAHRRTFLRHFVGEETAE